MKKELGQYFTPEHLVKTVLDLSEYSGDQILGKHVTDNSCGDGAFLVEVVSRYCNEFLKTSSNKNKLRDDLETFIHGIEIEKENVQATLSRLDDLAASFSIPRVVWDVVCDDSLCYDRFDGKIDYVVGNPPFVRCDLNNSAREKTSYFELSSFGNSDLYLAFCEKSLKQLNPNGTLAYIVPSTVFISMCSRKFRQKIIKENLLDKVLITGSNCFFDAMVYITAIVLKKNRDSLITRVFDYKKNSDIFYPVEINRVGKKDFYLNDNFYFGRKSEIDKLFEIGLSKPRYDVRVKKGISTKIDKFFIRSDKFEFDDYVIPCYKPSRNVMEYLFYPYRNGELIDYEELISNDLIKKYYEDNIRMFDNAKLRNKKWWGFGAGNSINSVFEKKYGVSDIIKNKTYVGFCDVGVGVRESFCVSAKLSLEEITSALNCDEFFRYIKSLSRFKSSGFFAITCVDLEKYLCYYINKKERND